MIAAKCLGPKGMEKGPSIVWTLSKLALKSGENRSICCARRVNFSFTGCSLQLHEVKLAILKETYPEI